MTEEVRMARGATLATALATPVVLTVAFLAAGGKGVLGAVFGLALAVAFFSATLLAVGAAGRVAIGMLLFLLRDTTAFDRAAFALSLVAGTCVYLAAEIRFAMRARIPYVEGSGEPHERGGRSPPRAPRPGAPVGRAADEKKASPR
jgi:ATP synthase protein I